MTALRSYCVAATRAIRELDHCSFGASDTGQDQPDWGEARRLLHRILESNGYELPATKGGRIEPSEDFLASASPSFSNGVPATCDLSVRPA
jgi:hypothetical protein